MGIAKPFAAAASSATSPDFLAASRPSRYRRIGNFLVPCSPAAESWYWRHLHGLQRLSRRSTLARWRRGGWEDAPWAEALKSRLHPALGTPLDCIWRPAASGISRAALGWVLREGELCAMVRWASGLDCAFLERERRALHTLAAVPGLAATTPQLIHTERRAAAAPEEGELLLIESACAGAPSEPRSSAVPAATAAGWLASFQIAAGAAGVWSSDALVAALAATASLTPLARQGLRVRALATVLTPGVWAHSDFWWGNLLFGAAGEFAVVDWSEIRRDAHPLHDAGFYLLTWGRDWVQQGRRLAPSAWLPLAFAPGAKFLPLAAAWFARYRDALHRAAWSATVESSFDAFLHHLPLVMAHYACYGQQAAAWSAACNAWAECERRLVF